jgi:hypothetical protein
MIAEDGFVPHPNSGTSTSLKYNENCFLQSTQGVEE